MIWVKFDKIIEIMQFGIKKLDKVMCAKYNGSILIPNEKSDKPKYKNNVLVVKPKKHFKSIATYYKKFRKVDVYAVEIIPMETLTETETSGKIKIFENQYIDKYLFKEPDNESIARIIIRSPNKENPDTYLVLVKIEDNSWTKLFQNFYKKNYKNFETKLKNGMIEIIIKENEQNIKNIKKKILEPFNKCYYLSET